MRPGSTSARAPRQQSAADMQMRGCTQQQSSQAWHTQQPQQPSSGLLRAAQAQPAAAWRGSPSPPLTAPHTPLHQYDDRLSSRHSASHHSSVLDPPLPAPQLQPRPPPQARHALHTPLTAAQHSAQVAPAAYSSRPSARRSSQRDSPSPPPSSHRAGYTDSAAAAAAPRAQTASSSLHDQVSAALHELESIKSHSFRPGTAGLLGASARLDGALPRPVIAGSPAQQAQHAAEVRTAEKLRTAKSIVKKLYKRNVKLMAEIKALKAHAKSASAATGTAEPAASGALELEDAESRFLEEGAHDPSSEEEEEDGDAGEEQSVQRRAGSDEEPENGAVASPRTARKARRRGSAASGKAPPGVGGSSHLLFLLGERDTMLNKQQALINTLHRKVNALQATLELQAGAAGTHGRASGGSGGDSSGGDAMFADAPSMEQYHSQLLTLRAAMSARLRSQMTQLLLSEAAAASEQGSQAGPPRPVISRRVAAYVSDLEKWLVWEASWRQVEKVALNAQCLQAEKQAQESWVRSRLLSSEVHELQQRIHHMDAKTRSIDTQLAAALERNRALEAENLRLKK